MDTDECHVVGALRHAGAYLYHTHCCTRTYQVDSAGNPHFNPVSPPRCHWPKGCFLPLRADPPAQFLSHKQLSYPEGFAAYFPLAQQLPYILVLMFSTVPLSRYRLFRDSSYQQQVVAAISSRYFIANCYQSSVTYGVSPRTKCRSWGVF